MLNQQDSTGKSILKLNYIQQFIADKSKAVNLIASTNLCVVSFSNWFYHIVWTPWNNTNYISLNLRSQLQNIHSL